MREVASAGARASHDLGKASGLRGAALTLLSYLGKRRVLTAEEIRGAAQAFQEAADKLDAKATETLNEARKTAGGS